MKLVTYLIIFLLVGISALVFAQTNPGTYAIRGIVIDSVSQKPAEFITISLKNHQKQAVKGQVTKEDGSFFMDKLPAGNYTLSIVSVGYQTKTVSVVLAAESRETNLGKLLISPSSNQLKDVVVTADRPLIKQEADRISYDLQADPESKSNSVLDMMRKVPLLTLDADDNIQLQGNSNYRILINGKPSSMMERNPKNILRSMPASTIQRIEVITTPPAKYDAEGLAGIINIITNKPIDNGYNGSLNASARFPTGGPGIGGTVGLKQGKFGLSAYGGGSLFDNPATVSNSRRVSKNAALSTLEQNGGRENNSRSGYIGAELSLEIDSLNLISAQFNTNGDRNRGESFQNSLLTDQTGSLQGYRSQNNSLVIGAGSDAALNYQKSFARKKGRLLTFSYRYYGFDRESTDALNASELLNFTLPNYRQTNISNANEHTGQIDYVHPFKKFSMEAGVKAIFRDNESDFQFREQNSGGDFVIDPARTNTFNNLQQVHSAYNTWQYSAKTWSIKAGIRVENTVVDADFTSSSTQVKQNYFNVVPSVALNFRFKNQSGISLGFSQRVQRPGINQLNPFVDRSNPNFETSGNPELRPAAGNQIQLGYNWFKKGNMNFGLMYNWIEGLIFPVSDYNTTTGITRTRFENTGSARVLGFNTSISYPFTKALSFNLNGRIGHGWAEGISNGKPIKNRGFMYGVNAAASLRMEKGWRLNMSGNLNGGNLTIQQRSNAFLSTSFSANKDVIKDKLSFSAFVNNPFTKYRTDIVNAFGPNFDQESFNQQYFRNAGASINYRFGKLKEAVKKSKRSIQNDDVSN